MGGHSVKPGRGPSVAGAVGGVVAVVWGLLWTASAVALLWDSPVPLNVRLVFPAFGLLFVALGLANTLYSVHNATARNRFSVFDVVPSDAEPDPLVPTASGRFCTQCGTRHRPTDRFCGGCGRLVAG